MRQDIVFVQQKLREGAPRTHIPALPPSQAPVLFDGSLDPKRHALEPPEDEDDGARKEGEESGLGVAGEPARGEDEVVAEVSNHEDGEPEGRELEEGKTEMVSAKNEG